MFYSNCCGVPMYDPEMTDICPQCLEHCDATPDEDEIACDKADRDYNAKIEDHEPTT